MHRSTNPPLHKINIEDYDRNIESDEDFSENDIGEKAEAITDLLFSHLMMETLRDMALFPKTIIPKFKEFAVQRPKIKRAQPKSKKYGFVTNQAEIKTFIEQLCTDTFESHPEIFKNLEKATGPSAI